MAFSNQILKTIDRIFQWRRNAFDRKHWILEGIDKNAKVLEIGPLDKPVFRGEAAFYVDRASREELMAFYATHPNVKLDAICETHFVWKQGRLTTIIPQDHIGTFDAVIASHVLEHMPDPLGMLQDCSRILKANGLLVLALPDKRKCFDYYRNSTLSGDWIQWSIQKNEIIDPVQAFQFASSSIAINRTIAWNEPVFLYNSMSFVGMDIQTAFNSVFRNEGNRIEDCHVSTFTPASFCLLAQECAMVGQLPLHLTEVSRGHGAEFFTRFVNRAPVTIHYEDRMALLAMAAKEQAESWRHLKGNPQPSGAVFPR